MDEIKQAIDDCDPEGGWRVVCRGQRHAVEFEITAELVALMRAVTVDTFCLTQCDIATCRDTDGHQHPCAALVALARKITGEGKP